jgi:hypothetical protein
MKLKKVLNMNVNKANNQISFNLKAKDSKKLGISPTKILDLEVPTRLGKKIVPEKDLFKSKSEKFSSSLIKRNKK